MPERRWITPEELVELWKRAKHVVLAMGVYVPNIADLYYEDEMANITYNHVNNPRESLAINDRVAGVAVFDWETGAVQQCYGSTALKSLKNLRKLTLLEDVAGMFDAQR